MKSFVTITSVAIAAASLVAGLESATAQVRVNDSAAREVSAAFLLNLTKPDPRPTAPGVVAGLQYQVGIVDAKLGFGLLVSPRGVSPVVQYIGGGGENLIGSRSLIVAAADQLGRRQADEFRFHIVKKVLTPANCPGLVSTTSFYNSLGNALAAPVVLAGPPPGIHSVSSEMPDWRVQIRVDSATLSLSGIEPAHPLFLDINNLIAAVARCLDGIPVSAEMDYTFSDGRALLPPGAKASKESADMHKARELADKYVAQRAALSTEIKYRPVLDVADDLGDRIVLGYRMDTDGKVFETSTGIALSYDKATGRLSTLETIYGSRGRPIDQ